MRAPSAIGRQPARDTIWADLVSRTIWAELVAEHDPGLLVSDSATGDDLIVVGTDRDQIAGAQTIWADPVAEHDPAVLVSDSVTEDDLIVVGTDRDQIAGIQPGDRPSVYRQRPVCFQKW